MTAGFPPAGRAVRAPSEDSTASAGGAPGVAAGALALGAAAGLSLRRQPDKAANSRTAAAPTALRASRHRCGSQGFFAAGGRPSRSKSRFSSSPASPETSIPSCTKVGRDHDAEARRERQVREDAIPRAPVGDLLAVARSDARRLGHVGGEVAASAPRSGSPPRAKTAASYFP